MVQYFAENLYGFVTTEFGWVQSYGTRCVRPPVLHGDVSRPRPITVGWSTYAQSLTGGPVKAMLTEPVTIRAWSFVRDDQPLGDIARQVGLALRDEVRDLESAGLRVIRVDEPALRELLPLRAAGRPSTWPGLSMSSGWSPVGWPTRRRSTPTCATRSSVPCSTRSTPWTRT